MKATLRIPTAEPYAYIEPVVEGTPEEILDVYETLTALVRPKNAPGQGLDTKEFNKCLDRYVTDGTGETEVYLRMNKEQQMVIQELKKCFKRLKAKEGEELRVRTESTEGVDYYSITERND